MTHRDNSMFWEIAEPFLAAGAQQSTMMGNACLRQDGAFFASLDRTTGDLVVKLPAARVSELVESGGANSFAPNGRTFKEWAAVSPNRHTAWSELMQESLTFASGA